MTGPPVARDRRRRRDVVGDLLRVLAGRGCRRRAGRRGSSSRRRCPAPGAAGRCSSARRSPAPGSARPWSSAIAARFSGWWTCEAEVRDDERVALVGDVDDARGADAVAVPGDAAVVVLEYSSTSTTYGLPLIVTGIGELRDRHVRPRQAADLAHLRVGLARLDLGEVDDDQAVADRRQVAAAAVVGDRHAVRVVLAARQMLRGSRGFVRSTAVVWPVPIDVG